MKKEKQVNINVKCLKCGENKIMILYVGENMDKWEKLAFDISEMKINDMKKGNSFCCSCERKR